MRSMLLIPVALLALTAPATAAPAAREVFAIIVTNNHSSELGRPDLRYADDDGAKYYEVFTLLAPPGNVHLLSELDRDTRGLFPHLVPIAKPPTRAAVIEAAADVAQRARAAREAGHTVDVYFVFAGHGDVDRGVGFLALADGAFDAAQLDKHVLSGIPATHTHVILDSCNSFFVINARRPGGRRFATPDDITEAFAKRLPHVGVFLSTSAEQEVYEWSELQSGIFSHAVRSGVLGAADVDGDGAVSYRELQAFVTIATAKVKNPLYRPNVFARGPAGKNDAPLVELGGVDAVAVGVGPDQTRLTVRDRDGLPWLDAHVERGASVELRIPRRVADGGSIEQLARGGAIAARWALPLAPHARVAMTALAPADQRADGRGPQDLLRMLFDEPFGPGAYARVDEYLVPVPIFGVAHEDAERMDLLLGAVADQQRSQRLLTGTMGLALGALYTGGYGYLRSRAEEAPPRSLDTVMFGLGGGLLLLGAYNLLSESDGESIHADYRRRMLARRGDDAAIVADTERRLHELAASHARRRKLAEYAGIGLAALSAGALLAFEAGKPDGPLTVEERRDRTSVRALTTTMFTMGALTAVFAHLMRTPEERIYGLWRDDPTIRRIPRFGVAPVDGGAMLQLGGSF